jgi:hypothetical protein
VSSTQPTHIHVRGWSASGSLRILRVLRVLRVLRILRVLRVHSACSKALVVVEVTGVWA